MGRPLVETEQPTEVLTPLNVGIRAYRRWRSLQELVVESLRACPWSAASARPVAACAAIAGQPVPVAWARAAAPRRAVSGPGRSPARRREPACCMKPLAGEVVWPALLLTLCSQWLQPPDGARSMAD